MAVLNARKLKLPDGLTAGKLFAGLAIAAFMAMMLSRPDYYLASARKGLALYATSVLPSLFPFYFCSLLLTNIGAARTVSDIFGKPVKLLYGVPSESAYVLLLSMISGYPVGASLTAELYGAGALTKEQAKAVASFASTSGPIFMLGTVGSAIFQDVRVGAVVLAAHYIAALINGLIFGLRGKDGLRRLFKKRGKRENSTSQNPPFPQNVRLLTGAEYDNLLSKTISGATLNMLYVGGYIVLCGMLVDTLPLLKVDILLENAVGFEASRPILAALYGLIEMTRGCIASAECSVLPLSVALCAGVVSLGGLSVTLQNYTFLSRCDMKLHEILVRKLCHSAIAAALGYLLGLAL